MSQSKASTKNRSEDGDHSGSQARSGNSKTLVIIRHAHRDTSHREDDNGLDEKGWRQAQAVTEFYQKRFAGKKPDRILSSPKLRCQETILGISEVSGVEVEVEDLLNEASEESSAEYYQKIEDFKRSWLKTEDQLWIACSHGDWIPLFMETLLQEEIELKKAGWAEIRLQDGRPTLIELRQDLLKNPN